MPSAPVNPRPYDPWETDPLPPPGVINRENHGYDQDGQDYPAFAKARGPQIFRISTPDDSEAEGNNRPPPTNVPVAREGGEWPSLGDVERETARARQERVQRERYEAEIRAERSKKSKSDFSWVEGFMEAERKKTRAEEARLPRQ